MKTIIFLLSVCATFAQEVPFGAWQQQADDTRYFVTQWSPSALRGFGLPIPQGQPEGIHVHILGSSNSSDFKVIVAAETASGVRVSGIGYAPRFQWGSTGVFVALGTDRITRIHSVSIVGLRSN